MNPNLPGSQQPQVTALRQKIRLLNFPSIPRFIPERLLSLQTLNYIKLFIVGSISILLVGKIISEGIILNDNIKESNKIKLVREQIINEVSHLKVLESQYKNYKDIYLRIALLDYKLGNNDESRRYIKKSLQVDPNFREGLVLGEKVGL